MSHREKPKVRKTTDEPASDGPEAKKAKIDPNETTMVKKVSFSFAWATRIAFL